MKATYEIMTNDFDTIEIESEQDLVKKYGDTFKNNEKYLVWEGGKFPIAWMQGIMVKGCLHQQYDEKCAEESIVKMNRQEN